MAINICKRQWKETFLANVFMLHGPWSTLKKLQHFQISKIANIANIHIYYNAKVSKNVSIGATVQK